MIRSRPRVQQTLIVCAVPNGVGRFWVIAAVIDAVLVTVAVGDGGGGERGQMLPGQMLTGQMLPPDICSP